MPMCRGSKSRSKKHARPSGRWWYWWPTNSMDSTGDGHHRLGLGIRPRAQTSRFWRKAMMYTADMLKVFNAHRADAIVIPGRGGSSWVDISTRANLDLPLGDPAMGGHGAFAFGLALALPERKVV